MKVEGGDALGCIDRARERKGTGGNEMMGGRYKVIFTRVKNIYSRRHKCSHRDWCRNWQQHLYKDSKSKGFCIFLIFIITFHRAFLLVLSPISALIFIQNPFRQCCYTANAFMLIFIFSLSGESWTQLKAIFNWLCNINTITTSNTSNVGLQHCWR